MKTAVALGSILCAALCGCARPETPREPEDPRIVAVFEGGEISIDELDSHIVSRPPAQRRLPGRDLADWFEELSRELAFSELMQLEAEREDLQRDPEFLATEDAARRSLLVDICISKDHQMTVEPPSGAEVRRAYEQRRSELAQRERRLVYNLFLRPDEEATPQGMREELRRLRDRAMGGESFSRLAAAHSDSETRHQDGLMGWIERGVLNPQLEEIVFSLPEGVPSQPLVNAEGGHLFFVDEIVGRRELTFEEAEEMLRARLLAQRRAEKIADWEDSLELPPGSVIPSRSRFFELLQRGDAAATLFQVGEQEVSMATFREAFQQTQAAQGATRSRRRQNPRELAWQLLQQMIRKEIVYAHCVADKSVDDAMLSEAVGQWRAQTLPAFATQRRIEAWMQDHESRLREFYDTNPGRFSSPPRWSLRSLAVAKGDSAFATMTRLEEAHSALDSGELELEALARELDGTIEELGWRTLPELAAFHPRVPSMISPLKAGEHSAPISIDESIVLFAVDERQEPESRGFDTDRGRVQRHYMSQYRNETMAEIEEDVLDTARFRVFPDRLEALRESWQETDPADTEELVSELVDLLEEIEATEE